jgi:hypothetical protein
MRPLPSELGDFSTFVLSESHNPAKLEKPHELIRTVAAHFFPE